MFVLVVAKEPVPGRTKTRLSPPCTPDEAATIAEAALADTFAAAVASGATEVVVALDGAPGRWLPPGVRVVPQGSGPLERRLATAWRATCGRGVQIGMDTPQLTAGDLDDAMDTLAGEDVDAVLGPAADGGWWLIGLPGADDRAFHGVPMSTAETGVHQRRRLEALGLRVADLRTMTDVDTFDDALAVAGAVPESRFAGAVRAVAAPPRAAGDDHASSDPVGHHVRRRPRARQPALVPGPRP